MFTPRLVAEANNYGESCYPGAVQLKAVGKLLEIVQRLLLLPLSTGS